MTFNNDMTYVPAGNRIPGVHHEYYTRFLGADIDVIGKVYETLEPDEVLVS